MENLRGFSITFYLLILIRLGKTEVILKQVASCYLLAILLLFVLIQQSYNPAEFPGNKRTKIPEVKDTSETSPPATKFFPSPK
jgi:hypothetical protein